MNGDNTPYAPTSTSHGLENGYLLVEVSGDQVTDRTVTMTFKQRTCAPSGCTYDTNGDVFSYALP
jgi:hypothetical protein